MTQLNDSRGDYGMRKSMLAVASHASAGLTQDGLSEPHAISALAALAQPTRLAILVRAGLLRSTREGRTIIYRSNVEGMRALIGFLVSECCDGHPELCNLVAADATACCGPAPEKANMRATKKSAKRKG